MPRLSRMWVFALLLLAFPLLTGSPRASDFVLRETATFDVQRLRVDAGAEGFRVTLPETEPDARPGSAGLPVRVLTREAPHGMRLRECRAIGSQWTTVNVEGSPRGTAAPLDYRPTSVESALREAAAKTETAVAGVLGGGYLRGRRLDSVEIRPVAFDAAAGVLRVAGRVDLELIFEDDPDEALTPRPGDWERESGFDRAVSRIAGPGSPAVAPARTRIYRPMVNGSDPYSPRFNPTEDGSAVRFLIITREDLVEQFQRLADRRTSLGIPTVVRTLNWIHANYPVGLDEAEDIRAFLREAVAHWGVEYVLLGGDVEVLPIRYAKSYYYGGEFIPTDQYLACLDGNWNANGNDIFGEPYVNSLFPGDGVDLYPDVWIGRAPIRTVNEATTFVDKVIRYEAEAPLGPGFGERVLGLAEVFFPQNWTEGDTLIFDGALLSESAKALAEPAADYLRLYENYNGYPGSLPETKQAAIAQINAGHNLILHVGHGYRNTMAVGINGETLTNGDADLLYNGTKQGLLYAINCTSSALDYDCIAEHFVRNKNGGVTASIGSTRIDFPATGWFYQDEFFDLVFNQGITLLGEAAAMQKLPWVAIAATEGEHRWTQFNMIYLGDPTMDLHTGAVSQLTVVVDEPYVLGTAQYTVHVTDSQGPVDGAVVCLNKVGDSYGVALTDASGIALVPFDPDSAGSATLGVRAHNHRSRVDSIQVGAPAGPHLYVASTVIDDATGGDGDGRLEAGETAWVYPVVANNGGGAATGIVVQLVSAPPGMVVLDPTASAGDLPGGMSGTSLDPLQIQIETGVADVSTLAATLSLSATGYSRQEPLVLYAGAPALDLYALALRDTVGNGDGNGVLQANEDQHLRLHVRNDGLGRSVGLTATLSSSDPAVTITDAISNYGDLEAGATGGGDGFQFRYSDNNLARALTVTFSDQRGAFLVTTVNLDKPAAPSGLQASGDQVSISLKWTKVSGTDLRGYAIYRSAASGGPYVRINPVTTDYISYYKDEELPPLTRYYYKVAAVDLSGNESALSPVISATTSLPEAGGFPLLLGTSVSTSPGMGYFNGDAKADLVSGGDELYAVLHDGTELLDGDKNAQTYGVFSKTGFGPFWTPPTVGDLDGDGVPEIVAAGWSSGFLYVWDSHGAVRPGWPRNMNLEELVNISCWGAAALGDVDNDGEMEIFINAGRYTFGFNADGTEVVDGDGNPATPGVFLVMGASANYSTPALADVDNDGELEIIVGSRDGKLYVMNPDGTPLPGFPFASGGDITGSPAVGDLDKDGLKEMVFGNGNLQVHAINKNLVEPPGWPTAANMNKDFDASPALADLNGDGYLDVVVCAGNGTAYAFRGQNGTLLPGWGFVIYDGSGAKVGLSSSPAIGNLDGDPEFEVCFGANDGNLYAFNVNGTLVDGFPIGTDNSIEGGPLLWDIDGDGLTEVVANSYDENLYVWDSPGAFDPGNQPWPMFHQNSRRTGEVDSPVWVELGLPDGTPGGAALLAPNSPNPFASRTAIRFSVPGAAAAVTPVRVEVFDIQGRRVRTLLDEPLAPGEHEVTFDGRGEGGRRLSGGVYFYRFSVPGNSWTRKMVLLP